VAVAGSFVRTTGSASKTSFGGCFFGVWALDSYPLDVIPLKGKEMYTYTHRIP